jgi:hypothetical protein
LRFLLAQSSNSTFVCQSAAADEHAIVSLRFDAEQSSQLALLTAGGAVRWLTLTQDTCVSASPARTAAVIDYLSLDQEACLGHAHSSGLPAATAYGAQDAGCLLRLTPFARAVVPPPMSAVALPLPMPANAVSFCAAWHSHSHSHSHYQLDEPQLPNGMRNGWDGAVAVLLCDQRVLFFASADRPASHYSQLPCLASIDLLCERALVTASFFSFDGSQNSIC